VIAQKGGEFELISVEVFVVDLVENIENYRRWLKLRMPQCRQSCVDIITKKWRLQKSHKIIPLNRDIAALFKKGFQFVQKIVKKLFPIGSFEGKMIIIKQKKLFQILKIGKRAKIRSGLLDNWLWRIRSQKMRRNENTGTNWLGLFGLKNSLGNSGHKVWLFGLFGRKKLSTRLLENLQNLGNLTGSNPVFELEFFDWTHLSKSGHQKILVTMGQKCSTLN